MIKWLDENLEEALLAMLLCGMALVMGIQVLKICPWLITIMVRRAYQIHVHMVSLPQHKLLHQKMHINQDRAVHSPLFREKQIRLCSSSSIIRLSWASFHISSLTASCT